MCRDIEQYRWSPDLSVHRIGLLNNSQQTLERIVNLLYICTLLTLLLYTYGGGTGGGGTDFQYLVVLHQYEILPTFR